MPPNAHSADIVLRGNFNPAILHPAWFGAHGLIHKSEAENAKLTVVSPQLTMFETDWFRLSANTDRFHVTASEEPHFEPLRDLVHGVFTLLEHTPVHAMGINRLFGYRLESQRELRNICNKFMPVADWKEILNNPETVSLIIQEERNTSVQGRRQIKIGPSVGYDPGLYVEVNDHYDNPVADKEPPTAYPLMDVLERQWKESTDRAYEIAEQIISVGRSSR